MTRRSRFQSSHDRSRTCGSRPSSSSSRRIRSGSCTEIRKNSRRPERRSLPRFLQNISSSRKRSRATWDRMTSSRLPKRIWSKTKSLRNNSSNSRKRRRRRARTGMTQSGCRLTGKQTLRSRGRTSLRSTSLSTWRRSAQEPPREARRERRRSEDRSSRSSPSDSGSNKSNSDQCQNRRARRNSLMKATQISKGSQKHSALLYRRSRLRRRGNN